MSLNWFGSIGVVVSIWLTPSFAVENQESVSLRFDPECILQVVATRKNIELRSEIPRPQIHLASQIVLSDFQDEMENRYGWRPDMVMNLYFPDSNEIYLIDLASVYERRGSLDSSLAHEFTHYLQVKYEGEVSGIANRDDILESQAVEIQRWFHSTYMEPGSEQLPCNAME